MNNYYFTLKSLTCLDVCKICQVSQLNPCVFLLLIVDWLYGAHNGVVGYFPAEYIRPLARHEVERTPSMRVSFHQYLDHNGMLVT